MRIKFLLLLLPVLFIGACSKSSDRTKVWVGIHDAANGNYNRMVISKVDDQTMKVELQTVFNGVFTTQITMDYVIVVSETEATISEAGEWPGKTDPFTYSGGLVRNGDINVSLTAVNQNDSSDVQHVYQGFRD